MRKLYFLLPGTGGKFACGGLWAELKTMRLAQHICSAEVVTYRQREKDTLFLDDLLQTPADDSAIFVLSWGFDVPKLIKKVGDRRHALYHAHSAGYGFSVPARIPIITVSRNTLGYWGQRAPHSLIYYLPNEISDEFCDRHLPRDIDVLVQARKSSSYLLNQLVPALQKDCKVMVVDSYIEDLAALFNRAKVYLYDSSEYWALQRVSEGFGLQPLEAIACGCQVFSSLNGGLSDYLDPGFNSQKIAGYSTKFDVVRIQKTLKSCDLPSRNISSDAEFLQEYRRNSILQKLEHVMNEVNNFFDHKPTDSADIPAFTKRHLTRLFLSKSFAKVRRRFQ
ncbi:glycosyltransferase [Vacuolonema iberomarrocanum]|uniref:glycosyltransferase n=1 Tax=Vacuolonema iberomarrocanum TaxID=3454632 RepID=UPI0019D86D69|nr:glycosyltransferase [filamentous cyanobacterium LEGE 07170]